MQPILLPNLCLLLIITGFNLIHIPQSFCQDQQYVACGEAYQCGNINFTYPFWGGNRRNTCGYPGFEVSCQGNVPTITVEPVIYRVLAPVNTLGHTLTVARDDLWGDDCPRFIHNTTLDFNIFTYGNNIVNLTLSYNCTTPPNFAPQPNQFNCSSVNSSNPTISFYSISNTGNNIPNLVNCTNNIRVPVNQTAAENLASPSRAALRAALIAGFPLQYEANNSVCTDCTRSGGRCGYNTDSNSFACYCSDREYDLTCNGTSTQSRNGMCSSSFRFHY